MLDFSKLKAFLYYEINVTQQLKFGFERVENTGKRRICWFPDFSKILLSQVLKAGIGQYRVIDI